MVPSGTNLAWSEADGGPGSPSGVKQVRQGMWFQGRAWPRDPHPTCEDKEVSPRVWNLRVFPDDARGCQCPFVLWLLPQGCAGWGNGKHG